MLRICNLRMTPLEKKTYYYLHELIDWHCIVVPNSSLTCGWDESKDQFPWQSEEVHDVVAAGRHLLLALFALLSLLLIVIWRGRV